MSETVVAPAPSGVQAPPPKTPSFGEKFRKEFATLEAIEKGQPPPAAPDDHASNLADPPKPVEPVKAAEPVAEAPKAEEVKEPLATASSPLDALLKKEEPKTEEKPAEPEVDGFDEAKPDWKRARQTMREQSGRIKELDQELKALKTQPKTDPTEVEGLRKERDHLKDMIAKQEDKMKAINAEYSEDFQKLQAAREKSANRILKQVKGTEVDGETLVAALSMPDGRFKTEQIKALLEPLDADDRTEVRVLIKELRDTDDQIYDFKKDAAGRWDSLQSKRDADAREAQEKAIKNLDAEFGKVSEVLPKEIVTMREVPEDVPGAEEWNTEIRDSIQKASAALKPGGADFKETVTRTAKGYRYDSLEARYLKLHSDYSDAMKRLAEFDSASPDVKFATKSPTEAPKSATGKYWEALRQRKSAEAGTI